MPDNQSTQPLAPSTPRPAWEHFHTHPELAEGAVHVWLADLALVERAGLAELLSAEERGRAARFARERDRQLWTLARGVLRQLLGRYLQADPGSLRLASGAHGKPALQHDRLAAAATGKRAATDLARLSFNLSHSGGLALYAFAATAAVGVDVEVARRPIDAIALAARAFGEELAGRLAELDPATREEEFLRAWVRHEAELKCRGTGLGGASSDAERSRPWTSGLEVGPRAAAAVAVESRPSELRCWRWRS
jgi:4'-phosphopantetheinyl transferase